MGGNLCQTVLGMLLEDDRVARRLDALEEAAQEELLWIHVLSRCPARLCTL